MREFYAHGKLLLSGEYLILDGAKGLALPTEKGQLLQIQDREDSRIQWESYDHRKELWFSMSCTIDFKELEASDPKIAKHLIALLKRAKDLNSEFLSHGLSAKSFLEFPRDWGLGSSSTLISTIAQWALIDPYQLLKGRFKGSGYDIACAQAKEAIIYSLEDSIPRSTPTQFNPDFADQLFFVHLGQKQISADAITAYQKIDFDKKAVIEKINKLTDDFVNAKNCSEFQESINKHEALLSSVLNIQPIKEQFFSDYDGAVKSLGAWGGDFALMCGSKKTPSYLIEKGFDIVIPFRDMVLY